MSQNRYRQLHTAENSPIALIDHQFQMTFGVANIDRATPINNVTLLAKVSQSQDRER